MVVRITAQKVVIPSKYAPPVETYKKVTDAERNSIQGVMSELA